jgi:hypothetical protein
MSSISEVETLIISNFPEAIIHIEKINNDSFFLVDHNTYKKDAFRILVRSIKLEILLKNRISNIFITEDDENRKYYELVLSVSTESTDLNKTQELFGDECDLTLAA